MMEADFTAGEAHEERHVGGVEGGAPFAVLVRYDVFPGRRAEAFAAGGNRHRFGRDAIADKSGGLGLQIHFDEGAGRLGVGVDPELILHDFDVLAFAGQPEGECLVALGARRRKSAILKEQFDLVVLATGMVPNTVNDKVPLHMTYDEMGFLLPVGGTPGVVGAGCVTSPMDVASCVQEATGAALKAIQATSRR